MSEDIRFLKLHEVIVIHDTLLEKYGGEPGIVGGTELLESAIAVPQAGTTSGYLHEDLPAMAAAYLYHIVMDHPFLDGNKRTGCAAAMTFLDRNGYPLVLSYEDLRDASLNLQTDRQSKKKITNILRRLLER